MNHDSDWGRSAWLSPAIMMGGLLFCVGFGAFVYRSDNERNRQSVIEATADRERLNRNNAQILTIVFEGLEAWQKSCAAQIDEDGTDIYDEGDEGTLVIPEWLAIEKSLI